VTVRELLLRERKDKRREALYLISYALSCPKETLLVELDRELGAEEMERVARLLEERKKGRPLAYMRGWTEFFGEEFCVTEATFVPRPETELLVEEALCILSSMGGRPCVVDVGAGCGACGIVIAKRTKARVVLVDISEEALVVAKRNARAHLVDVELVCSDLLTGFRVAPLFDLVLANLPYVAASEFDALPEEVRAYEPSVALLGGRSGFEVYERLLRGVSPYLKEGGRVLLEIGGGRQARRAKALLGSLGFCADVKEDASGRQRAVIAWRNWS